MLWPRKPSPESLPGPMAKLPPELSLTALGCLWMLVLIVNGLSGCVSLKTHRRALKEARIETYQKARKIAYWQHCNDAVQIISGKIDVEEIKQ